MLMQTGPAATPVGAPYSVPLSLPTLVPSSAAFGLGATGDGLLVDLKPKDARKLRCGWGGGTSSRWTPETVPTRRDMTRKVRVHRKTLSQHLKLDNDPLRL
jgi:hypothetical protein